MLSFRKCFSSFRSDISTKATAMQNYPQECDEHQITAAFVRPIELQRWNRRATPIPSCLSCSDRHSVGQISVVYNSTSPRT